MTQHQGLISALIIVIGFGLIYLFIWNFFVDASEAYKNWGKASRDVASLNGLIDSTPKLSKKFDELTLRAEPILKAVPVKFDDATYIVSFAGIVPQSGLILKGITMTQKEKEAFANISLDLSGTVSALERFLQILEHSLPFFELSEAKFNGKEALQDFQVDVKTYVGLPEAPLSEDDLAERLQMLTQALTTNLDIVNDEDFKAFKTRAEIPVSIPPNDRVGRTNPFAPF